jgi:alkaline phosphatase D
MRKIEMLVMWAIIGCLVGIPVSPVLGASFQSGWEKQTVRPWAGPEYWTNPLQDWRIADGRLECIVSGGNRNTHLLTHQLGAQSGNLSMSVRIGKLDAQSAREGKGLVGFYIAAQGPLKEYRNNAFFGTGIVAGLTADGKLAIGTPKNLQTSELSGGKALLEECELQVTGEMQGAEYLLTLTVHSSGGDVRGSIDYRLPAENARGNLALVCTIDPAVTTNRANRGGDMRFWFEDWQVSGNKVTADDEQVFGPILFAQHTLSRGIMKMTAQMTPVGPRESQVVAMEIWDDDAKAWDKLREAVIDPLSRTATFRIADWNDRNDVPYRLVYTYADANGARDTYWTGTVRKDPIDKNELVVAGFTGHQDYCFPNMTIAENVAKQNPDLLFFSGDQIYEGNAGYGIERSPVKTATLDYLRKWYQFGWGFRDLMRDIPSITLPDDHDVYQGNIWGQSGRSVPMEEHDTGGYAMDDVWVNMVQRTQVDHLPDPFDPTPIEQGITVYYTDMVYGRISFGVIEDRKFKSGPKGKVPPTDTRPDHFTDPNFDPATVNVEGAVLLGDRQIDFINNWTADWRGNDIKVALSQTIFCGSTSLHGGSLMRLVADLDCNGWPQAGRDRALDALRRGFAFHLAGDQHLASIIKQGIDDWDDAVWTQCVPSIAAGYPRVWAPLEPGKNRLPGMPDYTGEFKDGLGNKMTYWAAANPEKQNRKTPVELARDKASGYGITKLNRATRDITMECWPIDVDPLAPNAQQYPGWPKTVNQMDNYSRPAVAWLPTLKVSGVRNPVVQVIDESNDEVLYTVRLNTQSFQPKVFAAGTYTIVVSEPDDNLEQRKTGLTSSPRAGQSELDIKF